MPINSIHPEYTANFVRWTRSRDTYEGSDTVKAKGKMYLPALSGQTTVEYNSYRDRALYYGATARTLAGLVGSVLRRPPLIKVPEGMENLLEDVTNTGVSINQFMKIMLQEVLLTGRYSVLVDRAEDGGRPYLVGYQTESFVNWWDNTKVLLETVLEPAEDDPYEFSPVDIYRELVLTDEGYSVNVWSQADKSAEWSIIKSYAPSNRGVQIDNIPFFTVTPEGVTEDISRPPLLDLIEVNLSHYRSSADLEHGRHFTALPTPWVSGVDPNETELKIGSSAAWVLPDAGSKAGFLEFTGQGLTALENALKHKEQMMAILSARLFEKDSKVVESAHTAKIRHSSEASILTNIAQSVETGMIKILKTVAIWEGFDPDEVSVEVNKDYLDDVLDHQGLNAIIQAYQQGVISLDTLLYNMKKGELLPPDTTIEEEKEKLPTERVLEGTINE